MMDTSETESKKATNVEYVREHAFEVAPRYTDLSYIGEGAYGMVVYVCHILYWSNTGCEVVNI